MRRGIRREVLLQDSAQDPEVPQKKEKLLPSQQELPKEEKRKVITLDIH